MTAEEYKKEMLDKIEPFRVKNLRYPTKELTAKLEAFKSLSAEDQRIMRKFGLIEPLVLALWELEARKMWHDYKKDEWTNENDDEFYKNFSYEWK